MSFIGNVPAEAYSTVAKDTFSGNGSTTDFTLSLSATTNGVEVFVENVQQEPTTAYTISGTTLSFTAAPTSGTNNIYVIHRGPAVQQVVPPAGVAIDASTVTASGDVSIADKIVHTGDTNTAIRFPAADTVTVETGGSERVRVDSSGNVGIGTNSPQSSLHVAGAITQSPTGDGVHMGINGSYAQMQLNSTNHTIDFSTSGSDFAGRITYLGATNAMLFYTNGTEVARFDTSGNLQFNSGFGSVATAYGCRAWVNFNGSGTVAIREDGNVSSITDNGTGNFTVNFTTAMPDANYSAVGMGGNSGTSANLETIPSSQQTGSLTVISRNVANNTEIDASLVNVAIFR